MKSIWSRLRASFNAQSDVYLNSFETLEDRVLLSATPSYGVDKAHLFDEVQHVVVAGDPNGNPPVIQQDLIDPNVASSEYTGVGSFEINYNGSYYIGSGAVVGNGEYVLTAAHNFDITGDGNADVAAEDVRFILNATGDASSVITAEEIIFVENYDGYLTGDNVSITDWIEATNDDLALVKLSSSVSSGISIYGLDIDAFQPQEINLVGYGTTGDGVSGYTSYSASYTVKRTGYNTADGIFSSNAPEIWVADFDGPSGNGIFGQGSLGNDREVTIGGGDSGGPSFIEDSQGNLEIFGINNFTAGTSFGSQGYFGSIFGGVLVSNYSTWIYSNFTTPVDISLSSSSINENVANGTSVGELSVTDPDVGDVHTFELTNSAGGRFGINDDNELIVANASLIDFETNTSHDIVVRVTDYGGLIREETFTINITDINDNTPTIDNAGDYQVPENTTGIVYTANASDIDTVGEITYQFENVRDYQLFNLNSQTGDVSFITPPDFENPQSDNGNNNYVFKIRAFDGTNYSTSQQVRILVQDVDEVAPVLTSSLQVYVDENVSTSTPVYTITASDASGLTYTMRDVVGTYDHDLLSMDSSGNVYFRSSPNFDSPTDHNKNNIYAFEVSIVDDAGNETIELIKIHVQDVEAPVLTSSLHVYVDENVSTSTPVYTVTASDASGLTYTMREVVGTYDHDLLSMDSSGNVYFRSSPNFDSPTDHNKNNIYAFEVSIVDDAGNETIELIKIHVQDVEAPVLTSALHVYVDENVSTSTPVYTVTASDASGLTYTMREVVSTYDHDLLSMDSSGNVYFRSSPNFDSPTDHNKNNVYAFEVSIIDDAGNETIELIKIHVQDVVGI